MRPTEPIEIDGRTGEGGGQLVRIAVALASVCSQPVRITNVRGNRPGGARRDGGGKQASLNLDISSQDEKALSPLMFH